MQWTEFLIGVESIRLAAKLEQKVTDTDFVAVKDLAVVSLFGTEFIDADVSQISESKQMICSMNYSSIVTKDSVYEKSFIAQMDNMAVHPVCCRVAKMGRVPAMLQVSVLVSAPRTKVQTVGTNLHSMRRSLAMVARDLCEVTAIHTFNFLFANWSKATVVLPKSMNVGLRNAFADILWLMPTYDDSVNMSQL